MKIVVSALRTEHLSTVLFKAQDPFAETVHFYVSKEAQDDDSVIEFANGLQGAIAFADESEDYPEISEAEVDALLTKMASLGDVEELNFS